VTTDVELFRRIRVYVLQASGTMDVYVVENVTSVERAIALASAECTVKPKRILCVVLGEKDA
jgi:hypothetical protein